MDYLLCIHGRKRIWNVKLWKTNSPLSLKAKQVQRLKSGGDYNSTTLGVSHLDSETVFNPLSPHVELTVLQRHYQSAHTKQTAWVLLACSLGLFSVHGITELIPCRALAANFCEGFVSHSAFFLFPAKWKCHGQRQSRAKQTGDPLSVGLCHWLDEVKALWMISTSLLDHLPCLRLYPTWFYSANVYFGYCYTSKTRDQPDQIVECWKMFILTVALK